MTLNQGNATVSNSNDNARVTTYDGTDTEVGTTGNRYNVDSAISSITGGLVLTTSKKLRYDDMNAGTGGVARGTSIVLAAAATTIYSYSGTGVFYGFLVNLESSSSSSQNWQVNLLIDGEEIFNTTGLNTSDFVSSNIYDYGTAGSREATVLGIEMVDTVLYFQCSPQFPISYSTSVQIKVKVTAGSTKKFNAGLAILTKET